MNAHDLRLPQPLERVDGAARIVCKTGGLDDLYQRAPCRVLFPRAENGDPFTAVLLTTSGGLSGGDRLDIEVNVADNAAATVTTQAAEKIYRSSSGDSSVRVRLRIAPGA